MKSRIHAKVGTHSSKILVLWNDKPMKKGDWIYAMEASMYDQLHSTHRRLKKCKYWERYLVTETEPILFLSR